MKHKYKGFFRTYDINFLLIELVCLCFKIGTAQVQSPPPIHLYFMLNGNIFLPGDTVLISDIGPQLVDRRIPESTLVCVTTNVNIACCRTLDNDGETNVTAGAVGEWYYPNGAPVPRPSGNVVDFARIGFTHQVRLSKEVSNSTPSLGVYTCQVPELSTGYLHRAAITISTEKQNSSSMITVYNIVTPTPTVTTGIDHLTIIGSSIAVYSVGRDIVNLKLTTSDNNNTKHAPISVVIAVIIIMATAGCVVFIIVLLLVLLNKKNKNKNCKGKTEPDYYFAKTEAGAEVVYASPQDDYYSAVVNNHASDPNEKDSDYTHVSKELHNSKSANVFQEHDDVADIEVAKTYTQPKAPRDEAEDMTQTYSVVDKHAKKRMNHGQEIVNDASATTGGHELSDMYAVVNKKAVKKSQNRNAFDEYAVVNKSAKKKQNSPENAGDLYAVVDKSGKKTSHGHEEVEDDSAVVDEDI